MSEPKVRCSQCGVEILAATAQRTGGICMPCANGCSPELLAQARMPPEVTSQATYTRADVEAAVTRVFAEELRVEALNYLDLLGDIRESSREKFQVAAVELSEGKIGWLIRLMDADRRDVLVWWSMPTLRKHAKRYLGTAV